MQQVGLFLPHGALPKVTHPGCHLLGQPGDMGLNPGSEGRGGPAQSVRDADAGPTRPWPHRAGAGCTRAANRQHLRMIRLPTGPIKIADVPRIHDNHRLGFHQGPDHGHSYPPVFDHDPRGGQRLYLGHQGVHPPTWIKPHTYRSIQYRRHRGRDRRVGHPAASGPITRFAISRRLAPPYKGGAGEAA